MKVLKVTGSITSTIIFSYLGYWLLSRLTYFIVRDELTDSSLDSEFSQDKSTIDGFNENQAHRNVYNDINSYEQLSAN